MAEIDSNQIYDGLTFALHRAFPGARIYGGIIEQGLKDGDFNVLPILMGHAEQAVGRVQNKPTFDIVYYPSIAGGREECLRVAHVLSWELRIIQTPKGDKIHCSSFETNIEADALHCIVSYPYFAYMPETRDPMESLEIE